MKVRDNDGFAGTMLDTMCMLNKKVRRKCLSG